MPTAGNAAVLRQTSEHSLLRPKPGPPPSSARRDRVAQRRFPVRGSSRPSLPPVCFREKLAPLSGISPDVAERESLPGASEPSPDLRGPSAAAAVDHIFGERILQFS